MIAGRFRVKAGIDRETAEKLILDLESMGAVCSLEDESGQPGDRQGGVARSVESIPLATESPSGQDLGVLSQDSASFSLATLDGEEDEAPRPGQEAVASFDASAFAPPEASQKNEALQLAIDPKQRPTTADPGPAAGAAPDDGLGPVVTGAAVPAGMDQTNVPPPLVMDTGTHTSFDDGPALPPMSAGASSRGRGVTVSGAEARALVAQTMTRLAGAERARFAVGVFLALFLGFLPAHIFASVREGSAYDEIDAQVRTEQAQVETLEQWEALDVSRDDYLRRKKSARRNIALGGLVIWGLFGGGLGYLWFRRLDWDSYRRTS